MRIKTVTATSRQLVRLAWEQRSRRKQGMVTVEAALSLSALMFVFVAMLSGLHVLMQYQGLLNAAEQLAHTVARGDSGERMMATLVPHAQFQCSTTTLGEQELVHAQVTEKPRWFPLTLTANAYVLAEVAAS